MKLHKYEKAFDVEKRANHRKKKLVDRLMCSEAE
jgi:hypothetical protein